MYILGLGGLYTTIQPRNRGYFSSEAEKFPRARPCPREFFCRGRKITEVEVAISLDIARRDPIYIIYIPLFLIPLVTCTNFIDTQLYARLGGHITSRWAYNLDICPPRWAYNPPRGAIYTDIALSGRIFDFFGLYYRGILNKKHQNLVGI